MQKHLIYSNAISALLHQSWKSNESDKQISKNQIKLVSKLLISSGAGALAWNSIKHQQHLQNLTEAAELKEVYRSAVFQKQLHQEALDYVFGELSAAGIQAVIFKGWALSHYYSPAHIRPCGDIDLFVRPHDFKGASHCLGKVAKLITHEKTGDSRFIIEYNSQQPISHVVDLHKSLDRLGITCNDTLFDCAVKANSQNPLIYIPSIEHHLRLVTVHFLRHGGWRPLWLCDIAALLDAVDADFDWQTCLGSDPQLSVWLTSTFALAAELMGVDKNKLPQQYITAFPSWFSDTVLREWNAPYPSRFRRPTMSESFKRPTQLFKELKARWPNPIYASIMMNAPLKHRTPRMDQLIYFFNRTMKFVNNSSFS